MPSFFPDESVDVAAQVSPPAPIDHGIPSPLSLEDTNRNFGTTLTLDPGSLAPRRLVSCDVPQDELASFIITVVSNMKVIDIVESLEGSGAQTLIDIMEQVC